MIHFTGLQDLSSARCSYHRDKAKQSQAAQNINQYDCADQTKNLQRESKIVNSFQTIMKITRVVL